LHPLRFFSHFILRSVKMVSFLTYLLRNRMLNYLTEEIIKQINHSFIHSKIDRQIKSVSQ
jgi:hypothetical protein